MNAIGNMHYSNLKTVCLTHWANIRHRGLTFGQWAEHWFLSFTCVHLGLVIFLGCVRLRIMVPCICYNMISCIERFFVLYTTLRKTSLLCIVPFFYLEREVLLMMIWTAVWSARGKLGQNMTPEGPDAHNPILSESEFIVPSALMLCDHNIFFHCYARNKRFHTSSHSAAWWQDR